MCDLIAIARQSIIWTTNCYSLFIKAFAHPFECCVSALRLQRTTVIHRRMAFRMEIVQIINPIEWFSNLIKTRRNDRLSKNTPSLLPLPWRCQWATKKMRHSFIDVHSIHTAHLNDWRDTVECKCLFTNLLFCFFVSRVWCSTRFTNSSVLSSNFWNGSIYAMTFTNTASESNNCHFGIRCQPTFKRTNPFPFIIFIKDRLALPVVGFRLGCCWCWGKHSSSICVIF